jgi:diguanylate cyclase
MLETLRSSQKLFNKYKYESTIDGLTRLNNYRKFDDIFNNLIRISETKNEQLSLLYIDIDFFKKINDKYGHPEGDKVLVQLATILKECTRSFDIVSRNGGEEFTVLLLDCSFVKVNEIAENMRARVENHSFQLTIHNVHVTVSIGISSFQDTTKDANQLIDDADKALYEAKKTGRNKVCSA